MPKPSSAKRSYRSAAKFNRLEAAIYLAAFIDGEGCVYFRKATLANGKHHQARVITVTSTDKELAAAVSICLTKLGIEHNSYARARATPNRKDRTIIEVRRGPAMWRFRELVPIQHLEKRRKLDLALESYRGLHCHGCGVLHDRYTKGCGNCRSRKYHRDRKESRK